MHDAVNTSQLLSVINVRATIVIAVFQPCCTCHMLFVLLARCVVCVLGK